MDQIGTIAITGAAGGLGSAVVEELRTRPVSVVGLVRSNADATRLQDRGGRPVVGDLREPEALRELLEGADVVLHLAAWMGSPGGLDTAQEVNVAGTERVLRMASEVGVRRVVLASSIAVHGPVPDGVVNEDAPLREIGDPYGDTKKRAEERARRVADEVGIELVVLRPTMIYGPRSGSWTLTPVNAIRRGLPAIIGSGDDLLDAVYVDDVARAFVRAAQVPDAAGEAFIIGGAATDWNTFFGAYARMYDRPLRRLPAGPVKAAARVGAAVTSLFTGRPKVVPETIEVMTSRARYSHDKARDVLGWEPEVDLDEGMRRTEAWLRDTGRLAMPRVALVTGAASGLGSAVVRELLADGLQVYATDVDREGLAPLEAAGAIAYEMDVTDPAAVRAVRDRIESGGHTVDVVVNAAGLARPAPLMTQPDAMIELQFAVNAFGPLHVARAFGSAMRERGWGRIVNISSTNGFIVSPFMGAYSGAKHALEAMSDALRLELSPFGVEVVVVEPGAMKTPFAARAKRALTDGLEDEDPAWATYLRRFMDSSLWGDEGGTDPTVVARRVAKVARKGGRARILATADAYPVRLLAMLPVSIKDVIFKRLGGLRRTPEGDEAEA